MTSELWTKRETWTLRGQGELPPSVVFGETEMDLWPYRRRTVALLRRYGQASVEVGRVPSLLGREFFRSRVSSYTLRNFEDVVIFGRHGTGHRKTGCTAKEVAGDERSGRVFRLYCTYDSCISSKRAGY
jgi:hypothetical protein